MTIQSSKYPHPDTQTNETRIAAQRVQFSLLFGELTRRDSERARTITKTLLPWLQEDDYAQPIASVQHELEAIDGHDYADMVAAMRRGE